MPINEYDALLLGERPEANEYDRLLAEQADRGAAQLQQSMRAGASTTPDRRAEALQLGDRFKVPADVVERNLDLFRQKRTVERDDYDRILAETPHLSQWLQEPNHAAIAQDDMESLGALEWIASAPSRAFAQTINQQRYAALRYKSMSAPLTLEEQDQLNAYKFAAEEGGELGARNSWFRKAITGTASFLANQAPILEYGAAGALEGLAIGGTVGAVTGPGAIPAALATAAVTGSAGLLYGVLKSTYQQETANAYDEYLGFRDEVGRPLDPQVAKLAARVTGLINAPIEAGVQELLLRSIPGLSGLSVSAVRGAVKQALLQPTVRAALANAVGSYAKTLAGETAQEVLQRGVAILSGEIAKAVTKPAAIPGQLEPGNVDLYAQPRVANADGSISTVDSVSVNLDGREVLLPTVTPDGRHFAGTPEAKTKQAVDEYRVSGKHLGIFDTPQNATAFAEQLHTDYAAGLYDHAGPRRTAAEIAVDLTNEGMGALQSFAFGVLPGPVLSAVTNVQRARQAQRGAAFFHALGEGVAQSKTAQRLPAAVQTFLEQATKDGPVSHVYAPIDTWTTYWQSKGVDPGEIAAKVTGDPQAYDRAHRTGEDLQIPTSAYAVNLAATEHNAFFANELRLAPDQMNAREAHAALTATVDTAAAAATSTTETTAAPVREAILTQLETAGVSGAVAEPYATLYEHTFNALGERAGVDPLDVFKQYGLEIAREDLPASVNPTAAAAGIPASVGRPNETAEQRSARWIGHTRALISAVTRDALQQDPHVDVEGLRRDLELRLELHHEGQQAVADSGRDPGDLLRAIAGYGGIWWETRSGAYNGEIERLTEARDVAGIKAGTARVVHNRGRATWRGVPGVFKEDGLTPDGMVEALRQDQRFQHLEDINGLLDALDDALSGKHEQVDVNRFPGTADLPSIGVKLGTRWWEGRASTVDANRDATSDSADTGEGDTSFEFFQAPNDTVLEQPNRGSITFGGDRRFKIELLRNADLSTFLHETGHFYLEVLGDLADQVGAGDPATFTPEQRQLLADYGTLLQWMGVEGRAQIAVDQHEQFARGFEAYLMEGQAPSLELRHAFARFRAWLLGVYRSITALHVELTDDVRRVFDRMVATDAAIAAAESEAHITPLFLDAAAAGMTELEFASYQDQVREASQRAREELQARVLRELKREEFDWWIQERDAIRADVEREVGEQPVYRALSVMRTGTLPDGSSLVEGQPDVPIKLSRESLKAQFGPDVLKRLPRPYIYAKDSGISADAAAELFGFSSGDELIKTILEARPMRRVVEDEVDARMIAKHGDVMRDGRLQDLARAAVEGEHRQTVVQAELKALTKGMVQATIPSADVINRAAQQRIAATRIRDLRPGTFLMASRRAARQAFELLATGEDRAGAVRAKLQELINLALYREARDAKERVESMRRTLQGYGSTAARQRFGKAGADYLDQIDAFLDRYELGAVTQTALDRRESLRAFAQRLEAEGLPVEIPGELLDDARRINYQDITLDEFTGVYEAVEQIAHLVRLKNKLFAAAKARTFEESRDTLVSSIRLHNDTKRRPLEFRPADEKWRAVADWFASHSKMAMLAQVLDGHEDGGEFWEAIIRPLNAAADAEQARNEQAGAALSGLIEAAYPGRELAHLNRKLFIPAIGDSLSKEGRLVVALNWGNDGNRQRLLADPTRHWNDAQVHAILETLDERDWRFVQGVWDFVDSFWPEIAAKQQRVTGLAPEKVLPAPVDTRFGQLRGGYFPLAYDGRLVARAGVLQKTGEAGLVQQAAYVKATTRRGHTEARAEHVKLSVRLDFGVIFQHVQNVIHDLTHHETLVDVNRLLGDPDVQQAILETKGDQVYAQFTNGLKDIALGAAPATNILDKAATYARTGTQLAMMGWNLWTALQQPIGIVNGAERVGAVWVLRGLKRWLRDAVTMENTARWIYEVSPMMKSRGSTATQDLADVRQQLTQPGGWFDNLVRTVTLDTVSQLDIVDSFLWHIGQAQKVADIPTWLGMYEKTMAADPSDEQRAIALADQAVIDSQGGGQIKDLAQIQRGTPTAKLFLTFYSYGNTVYNRTAANVDRLRTQGSVGTFLGHYSLLSVMPALATLAVSRALGRSGDDDESWFVEFSKEWLSGSLNMMALTREFTGLLSDGVRGYAGPAGARVVQSVYQFAAQVKQGKVDQALVKSGTELAGIVFRFPALQVQRTVDGFIALTEGRTKNPAALLVGAPRKAAR